MIEVKHLVKKYGAHIAVNDISFTVESGQIYGFLGPNGAGKSTTMNIMTGCLAATDGQVLINGFDIFEQPKQAKKHIGYLPEIPPLYLDMTTDEYLHFVGNAKKIPTNELTKQLREIYEMTSLENVKDRLIKNLSKGYKQRIGIAQAMVGFPEIIILDEPTVGLDPKQIIEIRSLIKKLGEKHTVFLSSHILSEVSAICDKVIIISKGKLVAVDTPENLSKMLKGNMLSLKVRGSKKAVGEAVKAIDGINDLDVTDDNGSVKITLTSERDVRDDIFFALAEIKCPILEMSSNEIDLEYIFLSLTDSSDEASETVDKDKHEEKPEKTKSKAHDDEYYKPLFSVDGKNEGDDNK